MKAIGKKKSADGTEKTTVTIPEQFPTRRQVAERWACSTETIKRKTRAGILFPLRFNEKNIRYPLSQILAIEKQAAGGAN